MSMRNSNTQYGWITKSLHWMIAIGRWAMFYFGKYISNLELGPDNFHLIPRHKAFGMLLLALITIRILWRTTNPPPAALPAKPIEHLIAKSVHNALYILMLATPLFGWIGASARPKRNTVLMGGKSFDSRLSLPERSASNRYFLFSVAEKH